MLSKALILLLLVIKIANANVQLDRDVRSPAFDPSFYEEFLDSESCEQQLSYITRNNVLLWIQFLEAGLHIPRSILTGNIVDLGNYHQCLGINQQTNEDLTIQGKYCTINVPLNQNFEQLQLAEIPEWIDRPEWTAVNYNHELTMSNETMNRLKPLKAVNIGVRGRVERNDNILRSAIEGMGDIQFTLAVCIPKTCTVPEGISGLYFNFTALGLKYKEQTCRLPDDKPWVAADYVAVVVFSLLGLLTLLSTCYDFHSKFITKKDSKSVSVIGRSFSVYTNTRRLTTFVTNPGSLECIDGVRALAMLWVIVGHTFLTLPPVVNNLDGYEWMSSVRSFWITAAPITVDTFFLLSGLLLVYTTSGKLTGMKLLKNLHLFYLNRLLRMFPILATSVLLQASVFHRMADGPLWDDVAMQTNNCRLNWWINLLYLQNIVSTTTMCIGHSWYLAVDMHLHIISPLVLFWVLSDKKRTSWIALIASLLVILAAATTYNFIMEFPASSMAPARADDSIYYSTYFYINTLARASPFFVGMVFGYLLHLWRGKTLTISKCMIISMWVCAIICTSVAVFATEPMKDANWDNQTVDSLVNSFMRPMWVTGLGLAIVACVHGYGGPVNWFLCLRLWKLPSRISYAMYLLHYPLMFVLSGTYLAPIHFSIASCLYMFLSQLVIILLLAFVITLVIDSPFSTIFKLMLTPGTKKKGPVADITTRNILPTTKDGVTNEAFSEDVEATKELNNNN